MHRIFSVCAAVGALSLTATHQVQAQTVRDVKGTFGFTLAESCVQQNQFDTQGFDSSFKITDPKGAMTYGGASNGLMVFDGKGNVSFLQAAATNIFNDPTSFLAPGKIPLGFGFGPALPFTCKGTYDVSEGSVAMLTLGVTCTASISTSNPSNVGQSTVITGFSSTFNMTGAISRNPSHLALTDIGNSVQTVTIFDQDGSGNPLPNLIGQRICTRSTTADLVSRSTNLDGDSQ